MCEESLMCTLSPSPLWDTNLCSGQIPLLVHGYCLYEHVAYLPALSANCFLQECCLSVGLVEDDPETGGYRFCGTDPRKKNGSGSISVDRFLNRLLGLLISEQAALFSYFEATLASEVKTARSKGEIPVRRRSATDNCSLKMDAG